LGTICQLVHIDRTDKIAVATETAALACPISAFGLVFVPASGTLATCSSFGASEAQDMGLFRFVGEVVDVFAIFPQGHALIVVATIILIAHAVRIADEEASHLMLNTEVNHLARGLMPHITDTSFSTSGKLVLGTLQFLPTTGILLAVGLLLGDLAQMHGTLPLQGTDTTPSDDHGLVGVGGDGGKVVK